MFAYDTQLIGRHARLPYNPIDIQEDGVMTGPMSPKTIVLALATLSVAASRDALAQEHGIADSAIGRSLLVAAAVIPQNPRHVPLDTGFARVFRLETQYSRTSTANMPSMLILGLRSDDVRPDSLGWDVTVLGVRGGFARRGVGDDGITLSALELYFGARTLGHLEGRGPNLGVEVVAGWSGIEADTRASLALRFPVEFIRTRGPVPVALSIVPVMAWGQPRFRSCDDRGSGDGCSPHGFQFATGTGRFVLGTGITFSLRPGLSLTAGAQHMFARAQQPRFVLALGLGR